MNVLLIENDSIDQNSIKTFVNNHINKISIQSVSNVEQALLLASAVNFDLVIMDYFLESTDGPENIIEIKGNSTLKLTPLVITSHIYDRKNALLCLKLGADDFIDKKDLTSDRIFEIIEKTIFRVQIEQRTKEIYELAISAAEHDPLTGLGKIEKFKRATTRDSQRLKEEGLGYIVTIIKLKNLSTIRETFGERKHDDILIEVSKALSRSVSKAEYLTRLSKSTFLIFQIVKNSADNRDDGEKIIENALESAMAASAPGIALSFATGSARYPEDATNIEDIINCARLALNSNSPKNSNHKIYHEQLKSKSHSRFKVANKLYHSIKVNHESIQIEYQPIYQADRKIVASEALCRLNTAGKILSAVDFISIAEDGGSIGALGNIIIEKVFSDISNRNKEKIHLSTCINLSPIQLEDPDFSKIVRQLQAKYNIDPSEIELEITETVLFKPSYIATKNIAQLRSDGFKFALDDFGTGYSSLAHLRYIPFNTLKIDKSCIPKRTTSRSQQRFFSSVVNFAHNLDLQVVAEGIEHEWQFQMCVDLGVKRLQGYHMSHPVNAEQFDAIYLDQLSTIHG